MTTELTNSTGRELLALYCRILEELRAKNIIRSSNNPVADYSEFLFCLAFGWVREGNSKAGYDARDGAIRYQIKGRRLTRHNPSRQLSAIRKIEGKPFEFLAGIIFDENFGVHRAALVPLVTVAQRARKSDHVNGWLFRLDDSVWAVSGVIDVTETLRKSQSHEGHG
jgi:hypothetical protein